MSEINDYFERNEIYLFDHLAPALITFSVISTGYTKSDLKIRFPQMSGKTTGNEIAFVPTEQLYPPLFY